MTGRQPYHHTCYPLNSNRDPLARMETPSGEKPQHHCVGVVPSTWVRRPSALRNQAELRFRFWLAVAPGGWALSGEGRKWAETEWSNRRGRERDPIVGVRAGWVCTHRRRVESPSSEADIGVKKLRRNRPGNIYVICEWHAYREQPNALCRNRVVTHLLSSLLFLIRHHGWLEKLEYKINVIREH